MTSQVFDDINGSFDARLRENRLQSRTAKVMEHEVTLTSAVSVLDVKFNFQVLDRLHKPSFIAIERKTSNSITYLVYEVIGVNPVHFQMPGLNTSVPNVIRNEYLQTIDTSWGQSDETWIDVFAVPTGYRMDVDKNEVGFEKEALVPLVGAKAHLLSTETVKKFLCIENGTDIGRLAGLEIPLTIDIENLVRYHAGIFGFTGSGKSNLASYLVRLALEAVKDLTVVIFDVAGEYSIYLLDLLLKSGCVYSNEEFTSVDGFISSQAIPETLEERLSGKLERMVERLLSSNAVVKVEDTAEQGMDVGYILDLLKQRSDPSKSGGLTAKIYFDKLNKYFIDNSVSSDTLLSNLKQEHFGYLKEQLEKMKESLNEKTTLRSEIETLIIHIAEINKESKEALNFSTLASKILENNSKRLNIVYIPEPSTARRAVSEFINKLLYLKKRKGIKKKVLVLLDEAQEFIPDTKEKGDFSYHSNVAVEALLRQGRKYRAHCWLCTQRVARLNVSALQQLHSYFVSTMPRSYDRNVIADAFSLSFDVVDRTTQLETGEWLFVSYKATKQKNVPVFISTYNNEEILLSRLAN